MTKPNYLMISVASCAAAFQKEALGLVGTLAQELKSEAGALSTRHGVVSTGEYTNQLILFQTYEDMGGFERAFAQYMTSESYGKLKANPDFQLTTRSMCKIEDLSLRTESTDAPTFGVATRWGAPDLMLDDLRGELTHFENGGALVLRYCTTLAGPSVGRRLLLVGYPSMASIENTYAGLRESAGYQQILSKITLDWRNLFRIVGQT